MSDCRFTECIRISIHKVVYFQHWLMADVTQNSCRFVCIACPCEHHAPCSYAPVYSVVWSCIWASLVFSSSTKIWRGLQALRQAYVILSHAAVSPKGLVESAQKFDSGDILEWVQGQARDGHPSMWWPCSLCLSFSFREWVLLLCVTDCFSRRGEEGREKGVIGPMESGW